MPREIVSKLGELYPVLGLVIPTSKFFGHFDTDSIMSLFKAWRRDHSVAELLDEASSVGVRSWEELQKLGVFPEDLRELCN